MNFAEAVIDWQRVHGRHDLPWQNTRDPYRIWVSEIMLQQTQVATVIPYFHRFMARFPDVQALAAASLEDVLTAWAGLGYYSRARNLHRAAETIVRQYGGHFPRDFSGVEALPGIGRSTAGAILAFAYGERCAILDGNVKRLLARFEGIEGFPGERTVATALWTAAERLLPLREIERYTQGLMDLGATVCQRRQPVCTLCPVAEGCRAVRDHRVSEIPAPRPRKVLPHRRTTMLILEHEGTLLLERRPAPGIWGGLWCFPESAEGADHAIESLQRFGTRAETFDALSDVEHGFTHFRLTISPRHGRATHVTPIAGEAEWQWMSPDEIRHAAIPAPVHAILDRLQLPLFA